MIKIESIINNSKEEFDKFVSIFNESETAARIYLNVESKEIFTNTYNDLNEFTEFNDDYVVLFAKENEPEEKISAEDVLEAADHVLNNN